MFGGKILTVMKAVREYADRVCTDAERELFDLRWGSSADTHFFAELALQALVRVCCGGVAVGCLHHLVVAPAIQHFWVQGSGICACLRGIGLQEAPLFVWRHLRHQHHDQLLTSFLLRKARIPLCASLLHITTICYVCQLPILVKSHS